MIFITPEDLIGKTLTKKTEWKDIDTDAPSTVITKHKIAKVWHLADQAGFAFIEEYNPPLLDDQTPCMYLISYADAIKLVKGETK